MPVVAAIAALESTSFNPHQSQGTPHTEKYGSVRSYRLDPINKISVEAERSIPLSSYSEVPAVHRQHLLLLQADGQRQISVLAPDAPQPRKVLLLRDRLDLGIVSLKAPED